MRNPIILVPVADRVAANAAMSEVYGGDAGEPFQLWRGVAPGGIAPITLLYAAPGLDEEQFAALQALWAERFPDGVVLPAEAETCAETFSAYCAANSLAIVEPE